MKRMLFVALALVLTWVGTVCAQKDEPTVYVIKKGDTLWGLSARYLNDPYYWPNLWARNPEIGNPHVVVPGQKVLIYPDRIVVPGTQAQPVPPQMEGRDVSAPAVPSAPAAPASSTEVVEEQKLMVTGGEGFLMEREQLPLGYVVATDQDRVVIGKDDIVYLDIGTKQGAKVGDLLSVYRKDETISNPATKVVLGDKMVPLGVVRITDVRDKSSRAVIVSNFQEISSGSLVLPFREKRRESPLKAIGRELSGYVLTSLGGNKVIGAGDAVYIDLGRADGIEPGNMLFVERDVEPAGMYARSAVGKMPMELLGALVVVETGEHTSTALVVKSVNAIYRGDTVATYRDR